MDRPIAQKTWTAQRLALLLGTALLVAVAAAILVHFATPRLRVERDRLTLSTVERGTFQEYVVATGAVALGTRGLEARATVDRYAAARLAVGGRGRIEGGGEREVEIVGLAPSGPHDVELILRPSRPSAALIPGRSVQVRLDLGEPTIALLLGRGAFFQETGGRWAWVVDRTGRSATRRPIRLGRQNPETHEVLAGLSPGDRVITSSYSHFDGIDELILTP